MTEQPPGESAGRSTDPALLPEIYKQALSESVRALELPRATAARRLGRRIRDARIAGAARLVIDVLGRPANGET
jgi:hypothetical protein